MVHNKMSGDIRKIQKLLGHNNLQTTEIYTHITSKAVKKIKKLLDEETPKMNKKVITNINNYSRL